MQNATQDSEMLPWRNCTNHGPVRDVLARQTSCTEYTLYVKETFHRTLRSCVSLININFVV